MEELLPLKAFAYIMICTGPHLLIVALFHICTKLKSFALLREGQTNTHLPHNMRVRGNDSLMHIFETGVV